MVLLHSEKLFLILKERNILINFAVRKIRDDKSLKDLSNISGGESLLELYFGSFITKKLNYHFATLEKKKRDLGKILKLRGIMNNRDKVLLVDLITDGGSK